jgi:histone H3/H4
MADMNDSDVGSSDIGSLVVASKVKAIIKDKGLQTSSDALDALNKRVHALIDDAVSRAKDNKRATVKPQDI